MEKINTVAIPLRCDECVQPGYEKIGLVTACLAVLGPFSWSRRASRLSRKIPQQIDNRERQESSIVARPRE